MPSQAADGQSPDGRREAADWRTRRSPVPARPRSRGAEDNRLATIRLTGVSHHFAQPTGTLPVLDDVSFAVGDREVIAIVGPNGSGKSTLLRLIAGLLTPDAGTIEIDGTPVAAADRRVALVFQEPRLLPWRRAIDNVAFPLELAGIDRPTRRARAAALVERVGLGGFEGSFPRQLSGGMRQRVALARALAQEPGVVLLDEPFSALDALTRERFNAELLDIWQGTAASVVLVTHSIAEAVFVADRVLVLSARPGRIVGDVPVGVPRPRRIEAVDDVAYSRAAAAVRAQLLDAPAA